MKTRNEKIDELYECLTKLWFGSGGGCYTVGIERDRLKPLLHELFGNGTAINNEYMAAKIVEKSYTPPGEGFGYSDLERAAYQGIDAERTRCLAVVRSMDPHNEAEDHLIETIVRKMRGDE